MAVLCSSGGPSHDRCVSLILVWVSFLCDTNRKFLYALVLCLINAIFFMVFGFYPFVWLIRDVDLDQLTCVYCFYLAMDRQALCLLNRLVEFSRKNLDFLLCLVAYHTSVVILFYGPACVIEWTRQFIETCLCYLCLFMWFCVIAHRFSGRFCCLLVIGWLTVYVSNPFRFVFGVALCMGGRTAGRIGTQVATNMLLSFFAVE